MYLFNDSHVHLTNYVQEGPRLEQFVELMGDLVGRATLFGIPLQQEWSYRISGAHAPTYYLQTDAPLYYYSFTDAQIAMSYLSLPAAARARLDPMITGFNPADMYGADHIRRVLETFPGVFSGIGEFTIHKEFVSSKLGADVPTLSDPALARILDFAGEVGLLVIIHNDMDTPFPDEGAHPTFLAPMKSLLRRHPRTRIIWSHIGLGRIIRPVKDHLRIIEGILKDSLYEHVYFDISWDEVAKYLEMTETTAERSGNRCSNAAERSAVVSRSLSVRHRSGGADGSPQVHVRLRAVQSVVGVARSDDAREGLERQPPAPVRRGPPAGSCLGARPRPGAGVWQTQRPQRA